MESGEIVSVLGALAQETRLEVFRQLVQAGPGGLSAGEIAKRLEIPAPTLSFHLRALLHARLGSSERDGRSLIYAADFSVMGEVMGFLTRNCCTGTSDAPLE